MCRYTDEDDPEKLPYALVGAQLGRELTIAADTEHSVFHGTYVAKGGNHLDKYCKGGKEGKHPNFLCSLRSYYKTMY